MSRAIIDTTVLYAAGNRRGNRHDAGLSILQGVDRGSLPTVEIPDPVLIETMNGLSRDVGHEAAVDFLERLERGSNFAIRRESHAVWDTGMDLFERVSRLSLADALLVAAMTTDGIGYCYSFDDDFDGIDGVTRLDTASNPYETE